MRLALLAEPRGAVDEHARRLDLGRHVRELPLDRLEVGDALAELPAFERVGAGRVVGGLGDADRLRGDADPAAVERLHRDGEALAVLAEQTVGIDPHAVQHDVGGRARVEPELLFLLADLDALGVAVDDEARDARVGAREQDERAGVACVRRPLLATGDAPAVPVALGAQGGGVEPDSASVSAKAPRRSPRASGGRVLALLGVPLTTMGASRRSCAPRP